jgi:hypothetical protein
MLQGNNLQNFIEKHLDKKEDGNHEHYLINKYVLVEKENQKLKDKTLKKLISIVRRLCG